MKIRHQLLFTSISVVFIIMGLVAILNQSYTSSTRRGGIVTTLGADATWLGQTFFLLALLPLVVWVPPRFVGFFVVAWWFTSMVWVFAPLFLR